MSKRAITYARVSGNDRINTGGENLQHQLTLCREHVKKQGYLIVAELAEDDRGASGAVFDLPQLSKALDMATEGQYDVLVVRELDRLSRDLAKQLLIEQELKRANVTIEYVLYDFPDTPEGRLNKNFRAMLAEYELAKITQRMVRGARRKAESGIVVLSGGQPPYGYKRSEDGRSLVPNAEEAPIVKMIFEWYTRGKDGKLLSTNKIAECLSELKVPTWGDTHYSGVNVNRKRPSCSWAPVTIRHILHGEVYKGKWQYGKRNTDGAPNPENHRISVDVPALVDPEVWDRAQEQAARNIVIGPRNTKNHYLMQYRMHCARCGRQIGSLTTRRGTRAYSYYTCYGRRTDKTSGHEKCSLKPFRANDVDKAVWQWMMTLLTDPEALTSGLEAQRKQLEAANKPLRQRLSLVTKLIADNTTQLERVLDLYLAGDFTRDMLSERKARLEGTLVGLKREQTTIEERLKAQGIDENQIQTIHDFSRRVQDSLLHVQIDFATKRRLLELLGIEATLEVENGVKVAYVSCLLGEKVLSFAANATCNAAA